MSPTTPSRFGLIGAGTIAQTYSDVLRQTDVAELAAVADVRLDAARGIANIHDCPSFDSAAAMLNDVPLDAVIVCTPPASHKDLCLRALAHGCHVLCEKPLATNTAAAEAILQAAKQYDRCFTMASKFRFVADIVRAKSLISAGLIGDVVLFENTFTHRVDMGTRWNSKPHVSGGGVLIDNGTHSVDIIRYFLGALAEVEAVEGRRVQQLPVEDTVRLTLKTATGIMANVDLSWSFHKDSPYYVSIYGVHGTVHVGWQESKYRRSVDPHWVIFGDGYHKHQAFTDQLDNFVAAIRGESALRVLPEDSLASVSVIEAAYQSLNANCWVRVPDLL